MFPQFKTATTCVWALTLTFFGVVPAFGQTSSAIVGTVTDESGSVMPGATVEVSSAAIIGGTKATVTGAGGEYQFLDLRPGAYSILFSMSGFQSLRREGIVLTSAFTATVNAKLTVGSLKETVTVSGSSPVVDVKNNVSGTVLTEELKEAVPTGRTAGALVALMPGVVQSSLDVGGTRGLLSASGGEVHGSDSSDVTWNRDGGDLTSTRGGGGTSAGYYNEALNEEVAIQTVALPAEVATGGINYNMVTKSGGNRWEGFLFASGTSARFQSDNLSDDLKARGLAAPTRLNEMYDINPAFGGPILKDRLWFFTSYRRMVINRFAAGRFKPDGTQAPDDNDAHNVSLSLTTKLSANNELNASFDRAWKYNRNTRTGSGQCVPYPELVEDSATYLQPTFPRSATARFRSVLTNKVALEATAAYFNGTFTHPALENVGDLVRVDLTRGVVSGASACEADDIPIRWSGSLALSYAPTWRGSHNIRAGLQYQHPTFREWTPSNGARGDWAAYYRDGVPDSVRVFNLPTDIRESWLDVGLFLQDSWTITNRLTLNIGARLDHLNGKVDRQTADPGRWIEARDYPEISNTPNWTTLVPRLAAAYDVFGNGKTALKANASKYVQKIGESFMAAVNPMTHATDTRAWNDRNGDGRPQVDELGPSTGWTGGVSTRYAPDLRRPNQWEYSISVEHELVPSVGLTLSYFRRSYYDQIGTKNLAVPLESYLPVAITHPLTGSPFNVHNQDPTTRGLVDRVRDNYPGIEKYYNGFEAVVDKRLTGRLMVLGGVTIGAKRGTVNTSDLNNPNLLIENSGALNNDSTYILNLSGVYRLPADFVFAGHFKHQTGFPLARNLVVGRALVPGLTQVNQTVTVAARGEARLPNVNLLDLRLSRSFRSGAVSIEPLVDIYNALNVAVQLGEVQTIGPNLGRVSDTIDGRILRFGFKVSF